MKKLLKKLSVMRLEERVLFDAAAAAAAMEADQQNQQNEELQQQQQQLQEQLAEEPRWIPPQHFSGRSTGCCSGSTGRCGRGRGPSRRRSGRC